MRNTTNTTVKNNYEKKKHETYLVNTTLTSIVLPNALQTLLQMNENSHPPIPVENPINFIGEIVKMSLLFMPVSSVSQFTNYDNSSVCSATT